MSSRATLTISAPFTQTIELSLNLGALKDELPRHKNDFLYRAALPVVNTALERQFGRKTTFLRTSELKYSNKGATVTYSGILCKPVHGREHSLGLETFDTDSKPITTTLSFSLPGATDAE
jgi:hypothetical protein